MSSLTGEVNKAGVKNLKTTTANNSRQKDSLFTIRHAPRCNILSLHHPLAIAARINMRQS